MPRNKTKVDLQIELEAALKRVAELEQTLKDSEEKQDFTAVFRASPSQMALTDLGTGKYIEINDAFVNSLEFAREEVIGKTATELNLFVDPEQRQILLQRMRDQGFLRNEHVLVRAKSGAIRHGIFSAEFITTKEQKMLLTVMNDVTEKLEAEQRWQFALEGADEGVWDWNPQTNKVFYSPRWKLMLGFEENEIGNTLDEWSRRVHPDDLPGVMEQVKQHLSGGTPLYVSEHRIRCKDGTYKWVLDSGKVMEWAEDKTPLRVIGTHKDISERKRLAQAFEEEAVRRRVLFEESPDGILIVDASTAEFLEFNNRAAEQLGYTREEFSKLRIFDVEAKETTEETRAHIASVVQNGRSDFDTLQRTKQGEIRIVHVTSVMVDVLGKPVYYCIWRDITERKRAEESRRESDERYLLLFKGMTQGVIFQDGEGLLLHANPAAEKILGLTLEKMRGRKSEDPDWPTIREDGSILPAEEHVSVRVLNSGQPVSNTVIGVFNPHKQSYIWLNVNAFPQFKDGDARPYQIFTVFDDITDRKQAELALRESEKQLRSMLEISQAMSAPLEMELILQKIVENATSLLKLDSGAIYTLKGEDLFLEAATPPLPFEFPNELRRANVDDHPHIRSAISNGSIVILPDAKAADLSAAERVVVDSRGLRSIAYIPLMISENVIGVLIIASVDRLRSFSDNDLNLYTGFSGQAAQTIENVRLYKAEHEYAIELEAQIAERKRVEETLRESERNYHDLINGMHDTVWVIETDMHFLDVNDAAVKKLGYSREELLSMRVSDIDSAIAPEQIQQLIDRLSVEKMLMFETRHITKDGVEIPVEVSASLVTYTGRTVVMSIARDITKRKQSENALVASEKRLKSLVDSQTHFVIRVNMEGYYTYWNSRFEEEFGWIYKTNDLRNAQIMASVCLYHRERVISVVERCIAEPGQVISVEIDKPGRGGGVRTTLWEFVCITDDHNQPHEIQCMGIEITERKRVEKQLEDTERYYRALIENAPDGVVLIGGDGRFKYASPSVKRIFGYELDEVMQGDPNDTTHPDDLPRVLYEMSALIEDPSRVPIIQYRFKHKNGEWRWIESTFSNLLALPSVEAIIINFRDITERRNTLNELRKSEEKYRGLLESLDSIVANVDRKGTFLYINDTAAGQLGGVPAQFIGKNMYELFPENAANIQMHDIRTVVDADKGMVFENPSVVNGKARWYRTSIQPLHDENNQVVSVLINSTDIHELKTMQYELQELNRTLEEKVNQRTAEVQDLYENAPTGYHSIDREGKFVMVNQTELNWLGYTREEMIGHDLTEFINDASHHVFQDAFWLLKERGWVKDVEFEFVRKDGSMLPVLLNATSIYDEAGTFMMTRSTIFDNTERKQAELAVRESEATYRALFENSNDGIFLLSSTGEELRANQRALDMLGYTLDEYLALGQIKQNPFAIDAGQRKDADDKMEALLRGEVVPLYERVFTAKDGHKVPVEINLSPVRDENGKIFMVQSVVRDIAERKAAEDTLRKINKELERALQVKDEFLANMSHELRTPLNGILGFSEMLLSSEFGALNERQNKYVRYIDSSGRHLLGLINDLLDLAKIEAGKLDMFLGNVVISDLCQSSLMFVKQVALQKDIHLSFEQDMTCNYVSGDQRRLKQILVNLLSNAVKFTPDHGSVTLRVTANPIKDCIDFSVEDTGIGISPEDQLRLFKPFTQVDSGLARQYEGTGLGLSLVQKLTELHGGGVFVHSEVGKGSTFTVCIPGRNMIHTEEKTEDPISTELASQPGQGGAHGGKILLAEDMESNILLLGDYLKHQGYELIYASNGQEALEKAKETNLDLILMDIQMPVMDGLVATRRLRADSRFATIPIIALTALAMTGDRERCLEAGATEYLSKPVDLKQLKELIQTLLSKA